MKKSKTLFKRILSSVLSAACLLSGTAFAGTALLQQTNIEADAASTTATPATFSWDNATVYFLLTDRFKNGDTSNDNAYGRKQFSGDNRASFHGGDFAGITQEIESGYFDNLGVNAIWLTAPYEQIHGYIQGSKEFGHYSYHGYYVLDYTETDAAYGTKAEFQNLVDTAHEHGIRIIMDIVMNHAGYNSMYDMNEYGFGTLKSGWQSAYNGENIAAYHDYIDYDGNASDWANWWGADWIRCGVAGYSEDGGNSELTQCLTGLPDFRTESTATVGIPKILQTKWGKEGTLSAKTQKYGSSGTVTGYISTWLAEWVRTYGVDGFRCDTAKHVEKGSWKQLKDKCVAALREWKQNNPTKKLDDLDFWMTGECWNWRLRKSSGASDPYFSQGGFDSMINFETTGGGLVAQGVVAGTYSDYANKINSSDSFNGLSYLSSHDSTLARPSDMYSLGSAFLMLPGAVQIYYGDETARPLVGNFDGDGGAGHSLRSDMPWSNLDQNLIDHWGIVGRFRNSHVAVGGGQNVQLTATSGVAFGRTYSKNGVTDKVAGVIYASNNTDVTVTVSDIWADGTQLHNFYDDTYSVVNGGTVTFNSGAHGTILMEEPSVKRGIVKVSHVDKSTGTVLKTEMKSGAIGDSYTTSASTFEGYKSSGNSGNTSGVFGDDQIDVTYYYAFDSANYGYVVTKHLNSATNEEIADSVTTVGKIGTTYTTTAASVKHYELDTVPTNATGTVVKGTTTVTYKYNYVEPTNLTVHYYNVNNWSSVYLHAYSGGTTSVNYTGTWPGKAMTNDGNGWWSYEVEDAEEGYIMFNDGNGNQEPGKQQPGYTASGEVWVKDGKVNASGKVNVKYVNASGTVLGTETLTGMAGDSYTTTAKTFSGYSVISTPSNASGTFTENTITVVYTYDKVDPSTYGTIVTKYVDAATGAEIASSSTMSQKIGTTYTTTAASVSGYELASTPANATGTVKAGTTTVTYTYNAVQSNSLKIHYYNANNWSTVAIYAYKEGATATKYSGAWPGTVMTNDGNGWWSYEIEGITEATVIFNNNNNGAQEPSGVGTPGYSASGEVWFKNGNQSSSGKVIVKYVSTDGTVLATQTLTGIADGTTTYTTSAKTFDGYTLKTTPTNATGKFTSATITVTYTYEPDQLPVDDLVNTSSINSDKLTLGQRIYFSGSAEGGTAPYRYAYYYKRTSAKLWTTLGTEYGTSVSEGFSPKALGDFMIKISVKDSTGTVVDKDFTVTIVDGKSTAFKNNSTISTTGAKLGTKVKLVGAATGSSGYKYSFYYKRTTARLWYRIGSDFTSTSKAQFTPKAEGDFNVKIDIMDTNGEIVSRQFAVTISSDYDIATTTVNNSTISTNYAPVGTRIIVTAAATGGTKPYTYAFYYKRAAANQWKVIGTEYSTKATAGVTLKNAGDFIFKVCIRDANGGMVSKNLDVEMY